MSDLAQRLNDGAALSDEDKKALKENLETFKSSLFKQRKIHAKFIRHKRQNLKYTKYKKNH